MTPLEIISIVGGVLAILVSIKKLWPTFKKWWNNIQNAKLADRLEQIEKKVDENAHLARNVQIYMSERLELILKELSFNGGTSIKDALSRIEARQVITAETQNGILQLDHRGIFKADCDGHWVWVNEHILDLFGVRDAHQVHNRGWFTYIENAQRENVVISYFNAIKDKRHYRDDFVIYNSEAEKKVCVHIDCFVLRDDNDEVLGFLGFITEDVE